MKNKKWVIVMTALVLMVGFSAAIYGQPQEQLTQEQVSNPKEGNNKEMIAKNVLADTGRTDLYDLSDAQEVTVYYGGVLNKGQDDVIISVDFGPKNTVVAAYTPDGNVYEYVGDVGNFFDVQDVTFVPIPSLGKDVIILQEFANQNIGAYEASSLLKGYVYDNGDFRNVLNTPEKIQASWNYLWDNFDIKDASKWHRVTEDTQKNWKNKEVPNLELLRNQTYFEAKDANEKLLPKDSSFAEKSSRKIAEIFYWSDEWQHFILGEATEKATNEKVAVIENQNASPYILAGFEENGYRMIL